MKRSLKPYFQIFSALAVVFILSGCASLYIKGGKKAYNDLKYQDAIWYLEKGLEKKDNPEARRMLALSYAMTHNYTKANEQFDRTALYTDNSDNERIAEAHARMAAGQYKQAEQIAQGILSRDPGNKVAGSILTSCKKLNEMKADSFMFVVSQVSVPSAAPVFSATPIEGGFIIASTSSDKMADKDPYTNRGFFDLYETKLTGSTFGELVPLKGVNSPYHDAVAAVSPNGQTIIFTRSLQLNGGLMAAKGDNVSNTQLYTSKSAGNGTWEKPTLLPFCNAEYMFAHPALSSDGTTLYFSSNAPGGFGGMDLYYAKLQPDGTWGQPTNLGGDINSPGDDLFPTLRDDKTLYYSSTGLASLGGLDINYSQNVNGTWQLPKHLSYPINSGGDDFSLIYNKDGKTGYFSSDRGGDDRLYSFEEIKAIITLEGVVTGKDSGLPLGGARITIKNLTDGTEQVVFTDGEGRYTADLKPGKDYKIKTEVDGHFATEEDLSTKGIKEDKIFKQRTVLQEAYIAGKDGKDGKDAKDGKDGEGIGGKGDKGQGKGKYPIHNIYWDYNKWDIRPDGYPYLDDLVKLFRTNQELKFEIRSHCDSRGSYEYNDDLSSKRAKAVLEYLVDKGVPRSMITSKGYGERELVNNCSDGVYCTEEQHQENRRTEFIVTDKKKK
jgi:outer membrane protein OmpA-like peptidoglycan-associated protein